ncbi:hypothetical protein [Spirosoma sp. KUDC1026]|uniref:hypothetical protein n=1 Tax=Spirosoma sp. KUDC1026 TaxID=2745947 RepID=UPI00159BA434|nr:hypothetical protein [Spirosoma sp. KUDC1026]QKZ13892.1 hypothetical protein HU175_15125 [Spirosoma sp. KUDC1026]
MEDFTPEQLVVLANGYQTMARSLNEFQVSHWPDLTFEQHLDLNAYQSSLLNRAQDLQTSAVRPAFRDAAGVALRLQQAIDQAQESLKRLQTINVALNIGAVTVALASYVARANLRGIETALSELTDLLTFER